MIYKDEEKIKKIKFENDNYFVITDFDRTITSKESDDSWAASANKEILGEKIVKELDDLYEMYAPIELDYKMDLKEKERHMVEWYNRCMDLYYEHNLTKEKLEKSIKNSNMIFRKGAKEFLKEMNQKQVPVIILSAGIGNAIEQFLKDNCCYFDNMHIISNFIKFNEDGTMKKFEDKMIHTLNKTMEGHIPTEVYNKIKNKENKLLIGDLIEDKNMLQSNQWDESILASFLNSKIEENLPVYKENFDIVLTEEDASFMNIFK